MVLSSRRLETWGMTFGRFAVDRRGCRVTLPKFIRSEGVSQQDQKYPTSGEKREGREECGRSGWLDGVNERVPVTSDDVTRQSAANPVTP